MSAHAVIPPIHMRKFTPHDLSRQLTSLCADSCFLLWCALTMITTWAASCGPQERGLWARILAGVTNMSMYAACFAQATMTNDILARKSGYHSTIDYVLDNGNRYRNDIREAHSVFTSKRVNIGSLDLDNDDSNCALQPADMISWTVRRRHAGRLSAGFEPLTELFDEQYLEVPYKEEWMQTVADKLKEQAACASLSTPAPMDKLVNS